MATHQLPVQPLLLIHNFSWDRKHYWLDLIKSQEIPTDFKEKKKKKSQDRRLHKHTVQQMLYVRSGPLPPLFAYKIHLSREGGQPPPDCTGCNFPDCNFPFFCCRILTQEYFIQWTRRRFSLCKKGPGLVMRSLPKILFFMTCIPGGPRCPPI